jgi:hypothetical protein
MIAPDLIAATLQVRASFHARVCRSIFLGRKFYRPFCISWLESHSPPHDSLRIIGFLIRGYYDAAQAGAHLPAPASAYIFQWPIPNKFHWLESLMPPPPPPPP